jgi:hypothetical protein
VETTYAWELLYQAAILETDDTKLPKLLEQARGAIDFRLREVASNGDSPEEKQALEQALRALKVLRKERCHAADSSKS